MDTLATPILSLNISETGKDRAYWASRTGDESRNSVREAQIILVPWENFREGHAAVFPQGTTDFWRELSNKAEAGTRVAIASTPAQYEEITLHAREWKLATAFVSLVAFPFLLDVLASQVSDWISSSGEPNGVVEMEIIVEKPGHKCISIKYKGPANDLAATLAQHVNKCFPKEKVKPK